MTPRHLLTTLISRLGVGAPARARVCNGGTAAPASAQRRIGSLGREGWSGLCVAGLLLTLAFGVTPALANTFEGFRPPAIGEGKGSEAGQLELAAPFGVATGLNGNNGAAIAGSGVAVNDGNHDVYVADTGNHRVDEFESDGMFVRAFGKEVNKTKVDTPGATEAEKNVCSGGLEECQKGAVGKVPGELFGELAQPRFIAVDNPPGPGQGDVYVGDGVGREAANEQQLVELDGASGGSFTLSFEGHTTSPIPFSSRPPNSYEDVANTVSALEAATGEHGVFTVYDETNADGEEVALLVEFGGALKESVTGVLGCDGAALTPTPGKCETRVAREGSPLVVEGITKFNESGGLEEGWGEKGRLTGAGGYELVGQFSGLTVNSAGDVFASAGRTGQEIYEFEPSGAFGPDTKPVKLKYISLGASGIAVNSAGDFYVVSSSGYFHHEVSAAYEYSPSGEDLGRVSAERESEPPPTGLALNAASGALYLGLGDEIEQASPLLTFGSPPLQGSAGVAVDSSTGEAPFGGAVYAANTVEDRIDVNTLLLSAETLPATGVSATGMTLHGEVNPEGLPIENCYFEYGMSTSYGQSAECEPGAVGIGEGTSPVGVSARIAGLQGGTVYHFRVVAVKRGQPVPGVDLLAPVTLTLAVIAGAEAKDLSSGGATLTATVDPEGLAVETCTFEYGTGTGYGQSVACKPSAIGSGSEAVPVSARLNGLEANTTYRWRLSVKDANGEAYEPGHTFVYPTSGSELPDRRAYEMVTPPAKNGASIGTVFFGPSYGISEGEGSGSLRPGPERVVGESIQCLPGSESCTPTRGDDKAEGEPFEFTRAASGWASTALAPSASQFSENLVWLLGANEGNALFSMPTAPGAQDDWYKREAGAGGEGPEGTFTDIGPLSPPSAGPTVLENTDPEAQPVTTADLSHVVWDSTKQWPFAEELDPSGADGGYQALEYAGIGGSQPLLVGINEQGKPFSGCETDVGYGYPGHESTWNAVSADGRTVYFTTEGCGTQPKQLYARIDGEEPEVEGKRLKPETVAISASQCGAGHGSGEVECRQAPASDAVFAGASADGTKAFFRLSSRSGGDARGRMGRLSRDFGAKGSPRKLRTR
jgi:hypothetical protein